MMFTAFFPYFPYDIDTSAQRTLGVLLFLLICWLFKSLPFGITSITVLFLLPLFSVMSFETALSEFMSPSTFLVISSTAFALAFSKTNLAARLLKFIINIFGRNAKATLLSMMITTCLLSSITSNVPIVAVMTAIAILMLEKLELERGQSKFACTLMLGITISAIIGGYMTPIGSANNLIALNIYENFTDKNISFWEWMKIGIPLGIILLVVSWLFLIIVFKPEDIDNNKVNTILKEFSIPNRLTKKEILSILIISITVASWIITSVLKVSISMILISILSLTVFFLPGINIFSWSDFSTNISWDVVLTVGSAMSLGKAVIETGLAKWIMTIILKGQNILPVLAFLILISLALNFLHLAVPVSPSIITISLPILLSISDSLEINSKVFVMIVAVMSGCVLLLPIDPVPMITYNEKYYKLQHLFLVGSTLGSLWGIIVTLLSYYTY